MLAQDSGPSHEVKAPPLNKLNQPTSALVCSRAFLSTRRDGCRSRQQMLIPQHVTPAHSACPERTHPWPASRARALLLAGGLLCVGCPGGGGLGSTTSSATAYPPASAYEIDPEFSGEWSGDIDGLRGTLSIGRLDDRSFFGSFVTDDQSVEYTLLLEHTFIDTQEDGEVPSNRTTFTWQDGLGSRGKGWLLINREDSALTGSFGFGVATSGLGEWSFVRLNF